MGERFSDIPLWGNLVAKVFGSLLPDEGTSGLSDDEPDEHTIKKLREFHGRLKLALAEVQIVSPPKPFRRAHEKLGKTVEAAAKACDALCRQLEYGLKVMSSGFEDKGSVRRMLQAEEDVKKRAGDQQKAALEFAKEFVEACTRTPGVKEQLNLPKDIDELLGSIYAVAVGTRGRL